MCGTEYVDYTGRLVAIVSDDMQKVFETLMER